MLVFIQHSGNANFLYSVGVDFEGAYHIFSLKNEEEIGNKLNVLIVPDMEGERAKKESKVRNVVTYSEIGYESGKSFEECLLNYTLNKGAKKVLIPEDFPAKLAIFFKSNIDVSVVKSPISKLRMIKSKWEVEMIRESCLACVKAFKFLTKLLRRKRRCEELRELVELKLFSWGYLAENTIIASGVRSYEPHWIGYGEIEEHLVVDIFPKSRRHGYFGDFTRTIIFSDAKDELKDMLRVCVEAKNYAEKIAKPGIMAKEIHDAVCDIIESYGYSTLRKKCSEGFIHSTGHGVGLEVHEEPRIFNNEDILKEGMVFTIEPGIYLKKVGGVRVEDTVVLRKNNVEILTPCEDFPKLEGI